jgi:hypothetical protein
MPTLILLAVLQGFVSIPPIRVFQPYPDVKCPRGYSVWWPAGKEFDNDRYAECIKPITRPAARRIVTPAAKTERLTSNQRSRRLPRNAVSPVKLPASRDLASTSQSH